MDFKVTNLLTMTTKYSLEIGDEITILGHTVKVVNKHAELQDYVCQLSSPPLIIKYMKLSCRKTHLPTLANQWTTSVTFDAELSLPTITNYSKLWE